ncbi:MAG TPA: DUF222 domain-containing protein [Ruania sp.]|nr:DUF222 domain-containing protein [Ruania sp.]
MTLTTDAAVPRTAAEIAERLAAVRNELGVLARAPFAGLDEPAARAVVTGIEQITRGLEGLQDAAVGGLEAGRAWEGTGYRSFSVWWSAQTHRRTSTARAAQYQARNLREHLPLTAAALEAGRIGGEHVRVLTRFVTKTQAQRDQLRDPEAGEAFLVEQAGRLPVEMYTRLVKEWAVCADPEAADRGWREEGAREELFLSQVLDGTDLHGWLGLEHGQVVDEALRAATGVPAADDERTPAQRRAGALVHVCRAYLDGGVAQQGARVRPHLAITVDAVTLAALVAASRPGGGAEKDAFGSPTSAGAGSPDVCGTEVLAGARSGGAVVIPGERDVDQLRGAHPASLADGTPIPHGQLAKLLCDGELHRVVFGPEGQILDSGRTQRLFTAAQSRAIIARDRHCQYPGCTAPPWEGEIHHSIWWYHQGRTSTDNGVLLCWYHHTYVHQHHLTISQSIARAGPQELRHWVFTSPDGERIGAPPPPVPPPQE